MSGLTHNVSAQADELLDHIYEYGTNSEGVIHRINQLCDAAVEQLRTEVERLRGITNTPHFKPRSRAELKYLSHDELVSDVIRFELKYLHRSSMFFHLDQSHEKLRAELAASREREARMRAMIADDGHAMTFQSLGQYRTSLLRALAEGAQG